MHSPFTQTIPPALTEDLGKVNVDEEFPRIERGFYWLRSVVTFHITAVYQFRPGFVVLVTSRGQVTGFRVVYQAAEDIRSKSILVRCPSEALHSGAN